MVLNGCDDERKRLMGNSKSFSTELSRFVLYLILFLFFFIFLRKKEKGTGSNWAGESGMALLSMVCAPVAGRGGGDG